MEEQRARARASRDTGSQNAQMDLISDLVANNIQCEFLGIIKLCDTEILAVLDSGAQFSKRPFLS